MSIKGVSSIGSFIPPIVRNSFQNITTTKVVKIVAPLLVVLVALYVWMTRVQKPVFSITSIFGDLNKLPKFQGKDVLGGDKINLEIVGDHPVFVIEFGENPPFIGLQYVRTYSEDILGYDGVVLIPKGSHRTAVFFFQRYDGSPSSWVHRDGFLIDDCFENYMFNDPMARTWMKNLLEGKICGKPIWSFGHKMTGEDPLDGQFPTLQLWNPSLKDKLWRPGST